jgi:hypothetical protein
MRLRRRCCGCLSSGWGLTRWLVLSGGVSRGLGHGSRTDVDDAGRLLFWFWFDHKGTKVPVYFGLEEEQSCLRRAHGVAFGKPDPFIIMNARNTRRETLDTLVHELGHIALWSYRQLPNRGEAACRRLESIVGALMMCGLTLPEYPEGHAAMRRRAMRLKSRAESTC